MLEVSQRLADKLRADQSNQTTPKLVTEAWLLLFQRQPTDTERAAAIELADQHGLAALTRVLFNSNEYLLID